MPGKGSKYREFYDLSGRITCMIISRTSSNFSQILSKTAELAALERLKKSP